MSFRQCLIVERANDWYVVVGSETEHLARSVSIDELVTCVSLMVKLAGGKTPKCVIAPASTSCFFSSLACGDELDPKDRNALAFELESQIPLDAESMVADYVVAPRLASAPEPELTADAADPAADTTSDKRVAADADKRVSAVAIEIEPWRSLAESLEALGMTVHSIVPSAVLAARSLTRDDKGTDRSELILVDDNNGDAVTVEAGTISAWKHVPIEKTALGRHRSLDVPTISRCRVVGDNESQLETIQHSYAGCDVVSVPESLEERWLEGAELTFAKQSPKWFDLRRDQLGPSDPLRPILPHLRVVTAAAVACLLALAIGGWWRGKRIEAEITRINEQQRSAFIEAFPNSRVPAALLRRVQSEHTKFKGSRGATSEIEVPQSATEVLRAILAALPDSIRFRVKSLKILNGRVDLDLQVRTTVDAGALATALESHGFRVEPPVTTRKDAQSFDSVLEARWVGPPQNSPTPNDSVSGAQEQSREAVNSLRLHLVAKLGRPAP